MAENKTMDEIYRTLIKKYHTLCGMLGLSKEDREALLSGFGVDSSCDLSHHELLDICAHLSYLLDQRDGKESMDRLRKRLIAVIGKYLEACGRENKISLIKGTACRAAGIAEFNNIPRERLRSLYGAFQIKIRDIDAVSAMYERMTKTKNNNNNKR